MRLLSCVCSSSASGTLCPNSVHVWRNEGLIEMYSLCYLLPVPTGEHQGKPDRWLAMCTVGCESHVAIFTS